MPAIDNIAQKYMELSLWLNKLDSIAACDVKRMVVNGDLLGYGCRRSIRAYLQVSLTLQS